MDLAYGESPLLLSTETESKTRKIRRSPGNSTVGISADGGQRSGDQDIWSGPGCRKIVHTDQVWPESALYGTLLPKPRPDFQVILVLV
jgi:hypothetical protein